MHVRIVASIWNFLVEGFEVKSQFRD